MSSKIIDESLLTFFKVHAPFSQMDDAALAHVLAKIEIVYFADHDLLLSPQTTAPEHCFIVKQGRVRGVRSQSDETVFEAVVGECFPVGALLADRPVTAVYRAVGDVFVFRLARQDFNVLTRMSLPFLDYCTRRIGALLDQSRRDLQASYAAATAHEQSMLTQLGALIRRPPATCMPDTPLANVFARMQEQEVGSVIITGPQHTVQGILTRHDVLGRVVMPQVPLSTPVEQVMSTPAFCLDAEQSAAEAALLMAKHAIRHVPVMRAGMLIGVISERDLFSLQRLSLRAAGTAIRKANDVDALVHCAQDVRTLARNLVAQGVGAAHITRLMTELNDQIGQRIITLTLQAHALPDHAYCWLALGSEGRQEQTIATDQDNALLLTDAQQGNQARWLAFARAVNQALDACGYPLCKGNIMASNPQLCLTMAQWQTKFAGWIDSGNPEALLDASIYFDFRALAGNDVLASDLRSVVHANVRATPRFFHQLAANALRNQPPVDGFLSLLDNLLPGDGDHTVDLKMHGTVPLVDGARIFAYAHGIMATNTVQRLAQLKAHRFEQEELDAWIEAFHFLQLMRLRAQIEPTLVQIGNPNTIDVRALSNIDQRILKEAFRQSHKMQQRLALDFVRRT
jgi:CBS domain-containing protein